MSNFEEFFGELCKYKEENGNCNVPQAYVLENGFKLGKYVNDVRNGRKKLTDEERARLEEIGFIWRMRKKSRTFDEVYAMLVAYKEKYGMCRVPQTYVTETGEKLGLYVRDIRCGKREITYEQEVLLNEIGFTWEGIRHRTKQFVKETCLFCQKQLENDKVILQNTYAYCVFDEYAVSKGHMLIIPKRHCKDFFETKPREKVAIFSLIKKAKSMLDTEYAPDGYNIGMNCGEAAGQSIMHCHVHLIPRYAGDVENPRGGVRGVIPDKQNY
ncbi:MAG: Helicase associated domain protein [Clostridia bacterium]|nr:Helicase associated domain protein [Clostridia bacterium]